MEYNQNYSKIIDADCIPQRDTEVPEWFEDASSDADWIENKHPTLQSSNTTDANTIDTMELMEELCQKNKILEREWKDAEQKYQNVLLENEKLRVQLFNERHRNNKIQKRLKQIQGDQVKHAYQNITQTDLNELMPDIQEQSCQTSETVSYSTFTQTDETKIREKLTIYSNYTKDFCDTIAVKKSDMRALKETVGKLKEMVDNHETSWNTNVLIENKYKVDISELQNKIAILNDTVAKKQFEIDTLKVVNFNYGDIKTIVKENGVLRKILVKLEKRHREIEKIYKPLKRSPFLNEEEKAMIQELFYAYSNKLNTKTSMTDTRLVDTPRLTTSQKNLATLKMPSDCDIRKGSAEGESLFFKIPLTKLRFDDGCREEAEKPLSPKLQLTIENNLE